MELRLLRYFVAVADELHFSRAASRLHMAQPPLSQAIRRLEEELGVSLLSRTRRRVELTEPGRQFLASAREILDSVDRAAAQVQRSARGEVGHLTIGMVSLAVFDETLPRILRVYRERHPAVAITLLELSTGEQLESLRENRIQVGFLRPPIREAGVTLTTLLREPLLAVLPEAHPLARRRQIPLKALSSEPFITFPRVHGHGIVELMTGACLQAGFVPRISQEAKEVQTVIGFVAAGFGVSLLPSTVSRLKAGGVAYVPLSPPRTFVEIAAAYRETNASPLVAGFLGVLKETSAQRPATLSVAPKAPASS